MKKNGFVIQLIQWSIYSLIVICGWGRINPESLVFCEESHLRDFDLKRALSEWDQKKETLLKGGSLVYRYDETDENSIPNRENTDVCELKILGENSLYNNNQLRMVVRNVKYAFTLERKSENDSWRLNDLTYDTAPQSDNQSNIFPGTEPIYEGLTIEGIWLSDFLSEDKTKMIDHFVDQNGRIALKFAADYSLDITTKIVGGVLYFLPDDHYTMVQYELDMIENPPKGVVENAPEAIKSHTVKKIEYKEINGVLFPQVIRRIYNPETFFQPRTFTTQCDQPSTSVDRDVFYLSNYGFSEPDLPNSIGSVIRYTIICLGILLIAIGIYLRHSTSKA